MISRETWHREATLEEEILRLDHAVQRDPEDVEAALRAWDLTKRSGRLRSGFKVMDVPDTFLSHPFTYLRGLSSRVGTSQADRVDREGMWWAAHYSERLPLLSSGVAAASSHHLVEKEIPFFAAVRVHVGTTQGTIDMANMVNRYVSPIDGDLYISQPDSLLEAFRRVSLNRLLDLLRLAQVGMSPGLFQVGPRRPEIIKQEDWPHFRLNFPGVTETLYIWVRWRPNPLSRVVREAEAGRLLSWART